MHSIIEIFVKPLLLSLFHRSKSLFCTLFCKFCSRGGYNQRL